MADRLTTLRAFIRVVELGSFSAAARELRIRQSTVSKWIAALESELGVQLIERTTRALRTTDTGRDFYDRSREIVGSWDEAVDSVRARDRELQGRIRLNLPVVFGRRFVLPCLPVFLEEHPRLEMEVHLSDAYVNLVDAHMDLAVRVGLPVDSSFVATRLGETPRRLVASPQYLDQHGTIDQPGDLATHQCLLHTSLGGGDIWRLTRHDETTRVAVSGRISANNSDVLLHMAVAGHGVAMLAAWLVDDVIADGALKPLLGDFELPPAPIRAIRAPSRYIPPRIRALIEHLREDKPWQTAAS